MPRFDTTRDDEEVFQAGTGGGAVQYSAVRPGELSEMYYTLVSVLVDITGSVRNFAADLLAALKIVVRSCENCPRVDNLLIRVAVFNASVGLQELHGFRHYRDIDVDGDYSEFDCDGGTPLRDAIYNGVAATVAYGEQLVAMEYDVNAVVHIITDGDDNRSSVTPGMIAAQIETARTEEKIESLQVFLIGINTGQQQIVEYLTALRKDANLDASATFFLEKHGNT